MNLIAFLKSLPERMKKLNAEVEGSIHESYWKTASLESQFGFRWQKLTEQVDSMADEVAEQIAENRTQLDDIAADCVEDEGNPIVDELYEKIGEKQRGNETLDAVVWIGNVSLFPKHVEFACETEDGYLLQCEAVMSGFQVVRRMGRDVSLVAYTVRETAVILTPDAT